MNIHLDYGLGFTFFFIHFSRLISKIARQHGKHFSLKLGKPKNVVSWTPVEVAEILVGWNGILNWVGLIVTLW